MREHAQHVVVTVLSLIVSVIVLTSCGGTPGAPAGAINGEIADAPNTVTIAQGQDVFAPFILAAQPLVAITWRNDDTVAHVIVTTPEQRPFLNRQRVALTVAPKATARFTFDQPGLYHYYDNRFATWSDLYQRVVPNKGLPDYPMAMEGVIWVQGPIAGLPSAAKNSVIRQRDWIANNFVAIAQGGTVTWHNYDTDAHFFLPVLGYDAPINPVDIGINSLRGSDAVPPDGESKSITFTTPGLYYYYCFTHVNIDPTLLRAVAHSDASEYPIPMEGFVLVTGN